MSKLFTFAFACGKMNLRHKSNNHLSGNRCTFLQFWQKCTLPFCTLMHMSSEKKIYVAVNGATHFFVCKGEKTMKRFLALILCLAMLASMFTFTLPVSAADTVYSGECGAQGDNGLTLPQESLTFGVVGQ